MHPRPPVRRRRAARRLRQDAAGRPDGQVPADFFAALPQLKVLATRGILDRKLFAALPPGAALVNVGRGAHLVAKDMLDALDSGRLSRAILDVTDPEPLPPGHALWTHPRVFLTPHVASSTQPESAAPILLENIRRHQRGQALTDVIGPRARLLTSAPHGMPCKAHTTAASSRRRRQFEINVQRPGASMTP
jgi:hypothetical protein